ncbi:(2Fe-2S)-binding protein [Capillimicrobium parvum]|uniref:6-hydroxypseudooxynicotine dehydrogenase complex subunit beta n=1 Tax=Capillimicrobium parvum TaxID=2884022 RepID=A0A9E7C120_9ACTN|nr:(2Fe-2S)-binding protein [Capillimicrobium parvum]UGS35983.1 6-hydroxypseudooxynicotine dehydrogenase complex subunit beta [Capillimicrobium parvum]
MTSSKELVEVVMTVNQTEVTRTVEPRLTLADFIRDELDLTGTKLGCEHGVCGACTVLLEGEPVRSCCTLAVQAAGGTVQTVEELCRLPRGARLRESFKKHHALQCGFCTPGFLVTSYELLEDRDELTVEEARRELSGNICRCTGYQGIVAAVVEASGAD